MKLKIAKIISLSIFLAFLPLILDLILGAHQLSLASIGIFIGGAIAQGVLMGFRITLSYEHERIRERLRQFEKLEKGNLIHYV